MQATRTGMQGIIISTINTKKQLTNQRTVVTLGEIRIRRKARETATSQYS
jgi:hypothetical protein